MSHVLSAFLVEHAPIRFDVTVQLLQSTSQWQNVQQIVWLYRFGIQRSAGWMADKIQTTNLSSI